jgi:hypothetical protein
MVYPSTVVLGLLWTVVGSGYLTMTVPFMPLSSCSEQT